MEFRRITTALAVSCVLAGSLVPAAFAQGLDGDAAETAVAVGVDGGLITSGDASMAPDQPTTVSVGGDSNLGVPQPDLGRVPAGSGDGVFNVGLPPSISGTIVNDGGSISGSESSSVVAPTVEEGIAPVEEGVASVEEEAAAGEEEVVYVPTCVDYDSWYDAQIALENSGDPALIESLDPDYNGIACESGME